MPAFHGQWFTVNDWCKILPKFYSMLKGYEEQCMGQKLAAAVNKWGGIDLVNYEHGYDFGVFSNQFTFNVPAHRASLLELA